MKIFQFSYWHCFLSLYCTKSSISYRDNAPKTLLFAHVSFRVENAVNAYMRLLIAALRVASAITFIVVAEVDPLAEPDVFLAVTGSTSSINVVVKLRA